MLEILKSMIREEWRAHSSIFGNLMFALFPALLTAFAFACALLLPVFQTILPVKQVVLLAHYAFVLLGLGVGGFGLFGREVMNRRFGQISLLAYSSRILPVSEREIFLNFFVKDIIYYLLLWVIPFVLGFALASPFLAINLSYSPLLLLTLSLSFLTGLSLMFFLTTIYAHSSKILMSILILFAALGLLAASYFSIDLLALLPSFSFFYMPSLNLLFLSLILIAVPSSLSLIFLKMDYPEKQRRFKNSLAMLSNKLKFSRYSNFISKDFLDLQRSQGGFGKIIFSFLFPLAFVWVLLFIFLKFVPIVNFLVMFSIFLGLFSSSIYNWLTEFDLFTSYSFLPVRVSTVIKSKLNSYAIINSLSLIILILASSAMNQSAYFLPALFSFLSASSYAVAITVYLAGLHPNVLLYNAKIFFEYMALIAPVLIILILLSAINPFYLLASPILILISLYLINQSYKKWDTWEQPSY